MNMFMKSSGDFVLRALRALRLRDTVVFPSFQQCSKILLRIHPTTDGRNSTVPLYVQMYVLLTHGDVPTKGLLWSEWLSLGLVRPV